MTDTIENAWKTVRFRPEAVARPQTAEAVAALVRRAAAEGRRVKAIGGGHSMNYLFRTAGTLVDLGALDRLIEVDAESGEAELEAGMTIGDAILALEAHGLAFPSLGSWHTQTIAGAIATSTHGSSLVHGSLSDAVVAVEAVLADGSVARFEAEDDTLKAMRAHLGQLGLLTRVRLRVAPAFWLASHVASVSQDEGFATILDHARHHEYVNMLWLPYTGETCIRTLTRTGLRRRNEAAVALERRFTGRSRLGHTLEDVAIFAFGHAYLTLPRRLHRRYEAAVRKAFVEDDGAIDRAHRLFLYDQYREPTENHRLRVILNVEHALATDRLEAALAALDAVLARYRAAGRVINYPRIHVRFAPASDRTLVGLNDGRETAYVGLYIVGSIQHRRQIEIAEALEEALASHGGRPHWGKYRYLDDDRHEATYPGLAAFRRVRERLDPQGLFADGAAMFAGLDRFRRPRCLAMLRSLFDRNTYQPIRLL